MEDVVLKWGGGLKGFSRTCSEVGVDPKYFNGMFKVFCCEIVCKDGGVLRVVLL